MNKMIAASVVAVLCHVGTASAGVPAWCKDASEDASYQLKNLSSTDARVVVTTIALATCKPTAEASAAAAQIEAARQAWGKKLGMIEADWGDAISLAQAQLSGWGNPTEIPAISVKDYTAASPLDQYVIINAKIGLNAAREVELEGADYAGDMLEPNLSEVGRFALVDACVDYKPHQRAAPAYYAACQADIDAFDRAKFLTQLRGDTAHPTAGYYKMWLRLRLSTLAKRMAAQADEVKKILAKDAQYKKLWEGAAKGRAMWASANLDKSLIALATKMDSAVTFQSRKLFDGCEAATEAALEKVISEKVSANLFKDAPRDVPREKYDYDSPNRVAPPTFGGAAGPILADIPELLFVMNPYIQCHKPDNTVSDFLRGLLKYSPQLRGPRRAALAGMLREKIVLDDMNAKVDYPSSEQPYNTMNPSTETAGGVVDKVTEEGDHLAISFDKKLTKGEDCIKSHYTNKITRVNSDGSLSYELICDKVGIVTFDETPDGMRVDKVYKPLLKKGVQFAQYAGVVVAVWPSKTAKVPSHILGVAVK